MVVLNITNFKRRFDFKEVPICVITTYDTDVKAYRLLFFFFKLNTFAPAAIQTHFLTYITTISQNIMQGDVCSPLVSNNLVDLYVGRKLLETENTGTKTGLI